VRYVRGNRWILAVLIVAGLAALQFSACSNGSGEDASASTDEPAKVEPVKGTDLNEVTLSAQAAKRLGIETAPVRRRGAQEVIPYASVLYDPNGHTFTYTSPKSLVFVRSPISVARIDGGVAILSKGPPAGTAVVTVGSQELFGAEYEVEED
jgi:hypothetical protein